MMMNQCCCMVGWQKAFTLFNQGHCQRSWSSKISNMSCVYNLSSGFPELSCSVVIFTTPQLHFYSVLFLSMIIEFILNLFYLNNIVLLVLNFNCSNKLSLTLIVSVSFWLEWGCGAAFSPRFWKRRIRRKISAWGHINSSSGFEIQCKTVNLTHARTCQNHVTKVFSDLP